MACSVLYKQQLPVYNRLFLQHTVFEVQKGFKQKDIKIKKKVSTKGTEPSMCFTCDGSVAGIAHCYTILLT